MADAARREAGGEIGLIDEEGIDLVTWLAVAHGLCLGTKGRYRANETRG